MGLLNLRLHRTSFDLVSYVSLDHHQHCFIKVLQCEPAEKQILMCRGMR